MSLASKSTLFLFGSSHKTASLKIREQLSLSYSQMNDLYRMLSALPEIQECVILNTCNRVEIYGVGNSSQPHEYVREALCDVLSVDSAVVGEHSFAKTQKDVVDHLFSVSSGIESQLIGENEILGQVKKAYHHAQEYRSVGPYLHKVFQKSFQAAKWIRTHTGISKGQVSIGSVVVDLALRMFDNLSGVRILLMGTGDIGERTLQCFQSRGARTMVIASQSLPRAQGLAVKYGARAIQAKKEPLDISEYDIIIGATSRDHFILDKKEVESQLGTKRKKPLFMIDLGMPRNFESGITSLSYIYLYNLDDLAKIANVNLKSRNNTIEDCQQVIVERVSYLWKCLTEDKAPALYSKDNSQGAGCISADSLSN